MVFLRLAFDLRDAVKAEVITDIKLTQAASISVVVYS